MKNYCLLISTAILVGCGGPRNKNITLAKMKVIFADIKTIKELQVKDSSSGNDAVNSVLQDKTSSAIDELTANTYSLQGYFYKADSVPILVSNLKWVSINTVMPDSVYINLGGDYYAGNKARLDSLQGSFITCVGKIQTNIRKDINGITSGNAKVDVNFSVEEQPEIIEKN